MEELGRPPALAPARLPVRRRAGVHAAQPRDCRRVPDGARARGARARDTPWKAVLPDEAVMSGEPKTVTGDLVASGAIELMNANKISVLFVVEKGRPIGILHMHDLLRAGVA